MSELILALDVKNLDDAKPFVEEIPELEFYKVGLQLFLKEGLTIIDYLKKKNKKVFLDLKFHDIPNTVGEAVRQVINSGIDVLNIHISGGSEMIRKAVEIGKSENEKTKIIGVTVLTSLDRENLNDIGINLTPEEMVIKLAKLGYENGLDGVVCSPLESSKIKKNTSPKFLTFTPGITITSEKRDDQKRTLSVKEAVKEGSDYLIIGRPIRNSLNPRETVLKILSEMGI